MAPSPSILARRLQLQHIKETAEESEMMPLYCLLIVWGYTKELIMRSPNTGVLFAHQQD